jgi:hypothetical protein
MGARRIKQEKLRTMAKTIVVLKREGHPSLNRFLSSSFLRESLNCFLIHPPRSSAAFLPFPVLY